MIFVGGPFAGMSGGDIHALRLGQAAGRRLRMVTLVGPRSIFRSFQPGDSVCVLSPLLPFETCLGKAGLSLYVVVLVLRTLVYSFCAPYSSIAVASSPFLQDVVAVWVHRIRYSSIPVVYIHHSWDRSQRRQNLRSRLAHLQEASALRLAKWMDARMITSHDPTREMLIRLGFRPERVLRTGNAWDPPDRLDPRTVDHEHPLVVYCGRLTAEKGAIDMVEIAKRLLSEAPSYEIAMIGDGPLHSFVASQILEQGLSNVTLLGFVSDERKWAILRSASVFVSPSQEEGWGIAVDEALFAGVPTVTYKLDAYSRISGRIRQIALGNIGGMVDAIRESVDWCGTEELMVERPLSAETWDVIVENELRFIRGNACNGPAA